MEEQFEMDEELEDFPILDALCELLNRLPKNYALILNVPRYFEVLGVIILIICLLFYSGKEQGRKRQKYADNTSRKQEKTLENIG